MRKSNKSTLLQVKREWERSQGKKQKLGPSKQQTSTVNEQRCDDDNDASHHHFERILLERILHPRLPLIQHVIAATLHESSNLELPCWDDDDDELPQTDTEMLIRNKAKLPEASSLQLCLFLGAVRDMHTWELKTLQQVCSKRQIPSLRMRLGPVSEFTSKILTVVSYHHHHGRLFPACCRLLHRRLSLDKITDPISGTLLPSTESFLLHFVCLVPCSSDDVSAELQHRNLLLWNMVRCSVTALWRSRLASGEMSKSKTNQLPINRLTFVFDNNKLLTLRQEDLVRNMAELHQAAPSEHQILSAIKSHLDDSKISAKTSDEKKENEHLWRAIMKDSENPTGALDKPSDSHCVVFDFDMEPTVSSTNRKKNLFYSQCIHKSKTDFATATHRRTALVLLPLQNFSARATHPMPNQKQLTAMERRHADFVRLARRQRLKIVNGHSVVDTGLGSMDQLGATIAMTQHLCYQGRLGPVLDASQKRDHS